MTLCSLYYALWGIKGVATTNWLNHFSFHKPLSHIPHAHYENFLPHLQLCLPFVWNALNLVRVSPPAFVGGCLLEQRWLNSNYYIRTTVNCQWCVKEGGVSWHTFLSRGKYGGTQSSAGIIKITSGSARSYVAMSYAKDNILLKISLSSGACILCTSL